MQRTSFRISLCCLGVLALLAALMPRPAACVVLGETGTSFTFTAKQGSIRTGDGDSVPMWGFASATGDLQFPGPTLIVNQGDIVSIKLVNQLRLPVSLVFPGLSAKVDQANSKGGVQGLLTTEVPPDNGASFVTYTFTAAQPGTYTYYSGSHPELEVEMGMQGAIVVRPTGFDPATTIVPGTTGAAGGRKAYADASTAFDREYLMFLSEIDVEQHKAIARGELLSVDPTDRRPVTWFENGRTMPDTMADAQVSYLPNQPYNSMPMSHPGERVLIRFVGGGLDMHPLHTHGQNHLQIARDGMLLNSTMNNTLTPDLGVSDYTTTVVPGETVDAIYGVWTGGKLNWDVYGPKEGSPGYLRDFNWSQFLPLQSAIPAHTCNAPCNPAPAPGAVIPPGFVGFPACAAACSTANVTDPNCFDPVTFEYCPDHDKVFPLVLPTQTELTFGTMWGGTPFLGVPQSLPPVNTNDGLFHSQQNPGAGISFMFHSHNEREITTNNIFIGGMATMSLILPYTDNSGNPVRIDQYKP